MPVTPFHFGPGMLAKAVAPASVSLTVFAAVQVVIDCESGYYLLVAREWPVHRWAHTFLLATLIGLAVGGVMWVAARYLSKTRAPGPLWSDLGLKQCFVGGLLGGASHPFLDGIMHADIQPLRPWSTQNPLLGLVGVGALHLFCVAAGVCGVMLWIFRPAVSASR
jgi:membrane-bound metal-dependent hydrolase YbcI (DUF457 family)